MLAGRAVGNVPCGPQRVPPKPDQAAEGALVDGATLVAVAK